MSAEVPFVIESESGQPQVKRPAPWAFVAARIPRLICSQNPFYLISVCCVLHAAAQWFTGEQGPAFSPWPLLGLITGYIALLALTGYVIVRYGKVWDDARSILLLILLLFVELSMLFDETLVRDPATGKWLLLAGLGFAMGLSELLLHGLKIRLPWLFKIPYHLMLGLLFVYPLWLVSPGIRLPMETVLWRIVLFHVVAGLVFLTLIPAIRQSPTYTQPSGTPWRWPWYPWSLFVFLGICIAFRAYAISLSFDPVLNESLSAAMTFESTFGVYLLVPLILAAAVLLLETGVVSNRKNAIGIALGTPLACLYLSVPAAIGSGPYQQMLSPRVFGSAPTRWPRREAAQNAAASNATGWSLKDRCHTSHTTQTAFEEAVLPAF